MSKRQLEVDSNTIKLTELKEFNERTINFENNLGEQLNELKEVLREIGEKAWSWYAIDKPTPYDRSCYSKSIRITIEKLEGKKASAGEKEDIFDDE